MKRAKRQLPGWMHGPVSAALRAVLGIIQAAPVDDALRAAASLGRVYGGARFNRARLRRAADHLRVAFPDWSEDRCLDGALHAYEHLFSLGVEIAFADRLMNADAWVRRLRVGALQGPLRRLIEGRPAVLITGHCGNWEVLGYTVALLGFPMHALYRPLDLRPLDRWLRRTRERRGLTLVDKFGALRALPEILARGEPVGFVADQNAGDRGLFVPFFNRLASTYKSIGLLAMQFDADVMCGVARRLPEDERRHPPAGTVLNATDRDSPFVHQFEVVDVFGPAEWNTHPDPLFYLTARYRHAIERMVRRAPEQYLWMHRIWKSRPRHERAGQPFPGALREKIARLPWVTPEDLERIEEHSARDAATLAATGTTRLA